MRIPHRRHNKKGVIETNREIALVIWILIFGLHAVGQIAIWKGRSPPVGFAQKVDVAGLSLLMLMLWMIASIALSPYLKI